MFDDFKDEQKPEHPDETGVIVEVLDRKAICNHLKKFVSGQEKVLDKLSFIAHLYSKKILEQKRGVPLDNIPKLNFLMTGPTGSGKTHIIKALARCLDVAYHRIDCSTVTGEGWKGNNLSDRLGEFVQKSPSGIGIVHLDEFDKLGMSEQPNSSNSTDFALDKQTNILDLLDGMHSSPAGDKSPRFGPDMSKINNCLVILTGSFQCFRDNQKNVKAAIGFDRDPNEHKTIVTNWRKQLTQLGFIPELANRIISSEELDPYTKDDIRHIIYNTQNNAYEKYLNLSSVGDDYMRLSEDQLEKIIAEVHASDNGMRELESLLFETIYANEIESRK